MGISTFPAATGGGAINNDFVVDMNDTTNNSIDLPRAFVAGSYAITLSSGDTSYDIYFIDDNGASVGYSNSASIVASDSFTTVVILGVAIDEVISFSYSGAVADANGEGDEVGAGAYLVSISPSDLPTIDDTANVIGGNFGTAVEFYFESGTVSLAAKQVARADSTALIVTRPDSLSPDLDPWDVRVVNPGVPEPTGSNAHILAGTVDAGANPVFVTTSPLPNGTVNQVYAGTIVATDADGSVTYSITAGSLPAGLSFDGNTGVISGTATGNSQTFTVQALDDGGNSNTREFDLAITYAVGGSVTTSGNYTYHTFTTSGDFEALATLNSVEYIVLAGGGGGGGSLNGGLSGGGGGGGGGLVSSFTGYSSGSASAAASAVTVNAGTATVTVGGGGSRGNASPNSGADMNGNNGSDSSFGSFATAIGGGFGGAWNLQRNGNPGGSGGGSSMSGNTGGAGTTAQGQSGGNSNNQNVGAGGGGTYVAGQDGATNDAGDGGSGTHNALDERGWGAGGGGGAGSSGRAPGVGGGSSGNDNATYAGNGGNQNTAATNGTANYGGGGGGGHSVNNNVGYAAGSGGSGRVVIRYEA